MTESETAKYVKGVLSCKDPPTMGTMKEAVEWIEQKRFEKVSDYVHALEAQYNDLFSKASKIGGIDLPGGSKCTTFWFLLFVIFRCQLISFLFHTDAQ